jgi:pyruvate,water dikinase
VDPIDKIVISLSEIEASHADVVGGKAYQLSRLIQSGFRVPRGFSITTAAYRQFLKANSLQQGIRFEIGRKKISDMRWEEMWDSALRIRSMFSKSEIPNQIRQAIIEMLHTKSLQQPLAVRSSAPKEDSAQMSFAGLHESYVGINGEDALIDSVRLVWASLWSDAALLYQNELGLDPENSTMAVLVQELVEQDVSGVAFGCDPRDPGADRIIVEAVPGLCSNLVDGAVDPDRWILQRSTGKIMESKRGNRDEAKSEPLLSNDDLMHIHRAVRKIESDFGWTPDIEWTGVADQFTLLQARPVTTGDNREEDSKSYYLTLRPAEKRLKDLAVRVSEDLIPKLESEGKTLATMDISILKDEELAGEIARRNEIYEGWKKIYWDDFIPFAHGVRHLGTFYNDIMHPDDPYEFLHLLKNQEMLSTSRNEAFMEIALILRTDPALCNRLQTLLKNDTSDLEKSLNSLKETRSGAKFLTQFTALLEQFMDIDYGSDRLNERPDLTLRSILEMASSDSDLSRKAEQVSSKELEERFYTAAGQDHLHKAREALEIGRLSWRLRDDDNLLLGRVKSQYLRAIHEGVKRLADQGRIDGAGDVSDQSAEILVQALRNADIRVVIKEKETGKPRETMPAHYKPRQLRGQPASPGFVTGTVRRIKRTEDLGSFRSGDVLVCDAIQPNMTHLVPLASAIIERRGGMLIHGAIIAREMGIPCVNGIADAVELLQDGDIVSVDGHLGIVTVGEPDFNLELGSK